MLSPKRSLDSRHSRDQANTGVKKRGYNHKTSDDRPIRLASRPGMMNPASPLERSGMPRKVYREFPASRLLWRRMGSAVTCVATAVLAAACATDPPNSFEQRQSDMHAMDEFYSKLNADQNYYYPHVTIRVEDGVARLSGYVWNAQALYRAEDIATRVPGITKVVNNLELERDGVR